MNATILQGNTATPGPDTSAAERLKVLGGRPYHSRPDCPEEAAEP